MSNPKAKPLITLQSISKNYNNRRILENVSFSVLEGEIISILGLSGCGKSTLLKIICGFVLQDKGKVIYDKKEKGSLDFLKEPFLLQPIQK